MYVVANNLILEHFTDPNIYPQEDLECYELNQSWIQDHSQNTGSTSSGDKSCKIHSVHSTESTFPSLFQIQRNIDVLFDMSCFPHDESIYGLTWVKCVLIQQSTTMNTQMTAMNLLSGTAEQQEMNLQGILLSPK